MTHRLADHMRRYSVARGWYALLALLLVAQWGCSPSPHDLIALGEVDALTQRLDEQPELLHSRNRLEKTPIHYAVAYKKREAMALLEARGADLEAQDITGMTPLHVAAMLGRLEEAQWLLERGVSLEPKDVFGDTPAHTAAIFGRGQIIQELSRRGANLSTVNTEGKTPADLALENGQKKLALFIGQLNRMARLKKPVQKAS